MSSHIQRSYQEPDRGLSTHKERWKGEDKGVVTAWEVGRELAVKDPEMAQKAKNGELPPSVWKGGVAKKPKFKMRKYASLYYLAEWQALRGEDLDIDLNDEIDLTCSRTGVTMTYTFDMEKYGK